ncbi:MAG: hypothetical protein R3C53_17905 [Pirellulaceae bacterium]
MTSHHLIPRKKTYLTILVLALAISRVCPSAAAEGDDKPAADGPWISSVAWLDDGHLVGTRSQGLLLRPAQAVKIAVDQVGTDAEPEILGEAETSLWCVQPIADGKVIAGDYKGKLSIYGGGEPRGLDFETRWIRAMAAAPDGQMLAGTEDGKLVTFSPADGKETKRVEAGTAAIFDIAFSPAGDRVAVGCGDGTIRLLSWPALEAQSTMSRRNDAVWSLVFSNDGKHLVSGGADRRLQLWNVAEARSIASIAKTPDWVTSLVALPDSNLVVAGCMNGAIVVADYETQRPVKVDAQLESGIWSIALSPNHQQLAAGTRKHGFAVLEVADWISAGQAAADEAHKIQPPKPE